jgi:glycosyltransferase involved in cell wall biosynthesis
MPEAELFMYGENFEEYGPAHRWALRKGIAQNVRFCGFQSHDELPEKLRQMSLLLHPSLEEACPMTLLEAMASGLPVLGGADSGAVPWVLDYGRAGFLTDVRHPERIAASLLRCLEQEEERKYKQKIALERVLSIFSPRVVVEKYEQLYAKALGMSVRTT